MKWLDASEVALGLLATRRIPASALNPEHLYPPYDDAARYCQSSDWTEAGLLNKIGPSSLQTIKNAAASIGDIDPNTYLEAVDTAYKREVKANIFEKQAKKLRGGEDSNDAAVLEVIQSDFKLDRYVTADMIDDAKVVWRKTYYPPIDDNIGDPEDYNQSGFPEAHVIQLIGATGVGKTSLALTIIGSRAKHEPEEKQLLYTFEMTASQSVRRMMQVMGGLTIEERKRILVCDSMLRAEDVRADMNRLSATHKIGMAVVDFTELMIPGKADEQAVSWMYRSLQGAAKETGIPILALSLPSRFKQDAGVMGADAGRMSGMGEGLSGLVLTLYNPNQTLISQQKSTSLTAYDGQAWIVVAKSRFGYRLNGGPGGILVEFDGKSSWGRTTLGTRDVTSV